MRGRNSPVRQSMVFTQVGGPTQANIMGLEHVIICFHASLAANIIANIFIPSGLIHMSMLIFDIRFHVNKWRLIPNSRAEKRVVVPRLVPCHHGCTMAGHQPDLGAPFARGGRPGPGRADARQPARAPRDHNGWMPGAAAKQVV